MTNGELNDMLQGYYPINENLHAMPRMLAAWCESQRDPLPEPAHPVFEMSRFAPFRSRCMMFLSCMYATCFDHAQKTQRFQDHVYSSYKVCGGADFVSNK